MRRGKQRWLLWTMACALGATACAETGGGAAAQADAAVTGGDVAGEDALPKPVPVPPDPAFLQQFQQVIAQGKSMSLQEFLALHTPKDAAVPIQPGYDVLKAKHLDLIDQKLALTAGEKAKLTGNGFVVADRLQRDTMAQALLEVYQKDLPVVITTDLILQALHASYDDLLKTLELQVLAQTIGTALEQTHAALAKVDPGADADAKKAKQDADFFLAVARSLLAGSPVKSLGGAAVDGQVAEFLAHVKGEQLKEVQIFGVKRTMDFSQFKPRGHYAGVPELEKYFRALMWLGRVDFRFAEFDETTGQWAWRPRQVMAATILRQAVDLSGSAPGWQSADDLISLMVGPVDYIDLAGVKKLVQDQGLQSASDVAALTPAQVQDLMAKLTGGVFGKQRIASHFLKTDPFSAETTPLPPSFALLGQRFVIDSYVFSNVVYDRVLWQDQKVKRVLPSPLDALFVLGNDQVLPLLQSEFDKFPYWGALHDLRWLVDQHDATFWQSNVYNLWLDSLRQLNPPTTSAKYPFALRTPAWRDKTAHTQLASWAQLRHDTLLYAKQSYTGSVACEHPGAYVEPYPAFFQRLETLAGVAGQALANVQVKDPWTKTQIAKFFGTWKEVMAKLRLAAEHELAGQGTTKEDVEFLKKVISADPGCGEPVYSGWYPTLFFSAESLDKWRPTIADVHTNPNFGPLPGPNVLHVATGNVALMVLTVDTCTGAEAFVGPVFRYHEVDVKKIERLSDQEWEKMLKDGTAPPPPDWTTSFRAPAP